MRECWRAGGEEEEGVSVRCRAITEEDERVVYLCCFMYEHTDEIIAYICVQLFVEGHVLPCMSDCTLVDSAHSSREAAVLWEDTGTTVTKSCLEMIAT